ncbi:GxxExxY protein [Stieleria mannarensis]|uniref:GxxExxY protein n=1 Tax=Stieleria mannarensis TaxID=2755585 RepID=UPI0015FFBB06|nr:GxxExxY protein [Rhodopirellula sp. JC639]
MPISCPLSIRSPSYEAFKELDYCRVMPQAFCTHNCLGPLADEFVYKSDFAARLRESGLETLIDVPVYVTFDSFEKRYVLDVVVGRCGVYELKVARALTPEHEMQLLNYLYLLDLERGKLINFRTDRVECRFVNSGTTRSQRQRFGVDDVCWKDTSPLRHLCIEILRDWGTGLSLPLYYQALTHLLGGEERVVKQVPMNRDGLPLGRQRFHTLNDKSAFEVTALLNGHRQYEQNLRKLLRHSPFEAIHWVNITLKEVRFLTVV